jgi:hypothetical protein
MLLKQLAGIDFGLPLSYFALSGFNNGFRYLFCFSLIPVTGLEVLLEVCRRNQSKFKLDREP